MTNRFPPVPKEDRFADDIGYFTKIPKKKPPKKPAPRLQNLLGKT